MNRTELQSFKRHITRNSSFLPEYRVPLKDRMMYAWGLEWDPEYKSKCIRFPIVEGVDYKELVESFKSVRVEVTRQIKHEYLNVIYVLYKERTENNER